MKTTCIALASLLLLLQGCGDEGVDKDWEEEIVIQLFKAKTTTLSGLAVEASVGTEKPKKLVINKDGKFFDSCETNQVRIIPKKLSGAWGPVKVKVTNANSFGGITYAERTISVPTSDVVKILLSKAKEMVPSGTCTPTVKLNPLGGDCADDGDCEDGKCLKKAEDASRSYTFHAGYCTKDCANGGTCPTGGKCVPFGQVGQTNKPHYCMKKCTAVADCRAHDGYDCPGDICLPN